MSRDQEVRDELEEHGWKMLSPKYINLKVESKFLCPENHIVYMPYGKLRKAFRCPICAKNNFTQVEKIEIPAKGKDVFRILAMDQATQISGWALFDNDSLVKFGKVNVPESLDKVERIYSMKCWLISMIENVKPDLIVFEDIQYQPEKGENRTQASFIGVTTFKALAELLGVLTSSCFENKITYRIVPSATWRSGVGVLGKTRTDKKRSAQILIKKNYDVYVSEDEADAICIGRYASKAFYKPVEMVKW